MDEELLTLDDAVVQQDIGDKIKGKVGTWKEYVVSYRIWGYKDELVDNMVIRENINSESQLEQTRSENRSNNPMNCSYTEKIYDPAYDENNKFYWKLISDKQHATSGSCNDAFKSNIEEKGVDHTQRTNAKTVTRKNVFMILLENTIILDYHRISSKFPKYSEIRRQILEYEEKQGLNLDKVARVLLLNMFIL